jgi:protein MpaA
MDIKIHPMPAMPLLADPPPWGGKAAGLPVRTVGNSMLGNAINLYNPRRSNLLLVGGVHGDESEGVFLAHLVLTAGCPVPVVPSLNPDGTLMHQRWNHNGVDLNRNLPTPDWEPTPRNPRYPPGSAPGSEPETQAFLAALKLTGATTVISMHSYKETFVEVERPPEAVPEPFNAALAEYTAAVGIPRKDSIGYPTPGALGSYGRAAGLLVFTYELMRGKSHGELYQLLAPFVRLLERLDALRFEDAGATMAP